MSYDGGMNNQQNPSDASPQERRTGRVILGIIIVLVVVLVGRKFLRPTDGSLETFTASFETAFEGNAHQYAYGVSYDPSIFTVTSESADNKLAFTDKASGATHQIVFFDNSGAGFVSSREFWESYGQEEYAASCDDCKETEANFEMTGAKDVLVVGNDTEEWIIFEHTPGFVVAELKKPSEEARKVLASLTLSEGNSSADDAMMKPSENSSMETEKTGSNAMMEKETTSTSFAVYFMNPSVKPSITCTAVVAVRRTIPKTLETGRAAITELLKGPTAEERAAGYMSEIPEGVQLNTITLVNGEMKVDFSERLNEGGGSCHVAGVTEQIRQTLLQFSTVKSVTISVAGKTEGVLQP